MYCPECNHDPCRYLPDEARTVKGYDRFIRELAQSREHSREKVEIIIIHALLLRLDSTELDDELERQI